MLTQSGYNGLRMLQVHCGSDALISSCKPASDLSVLNWDCLICITDALFLNQYGPLATEFCYHGMATLATSTSEPILNDELPILKTGLPTQNRVVKWRSLFVHACRVGLFIGILLLIRNQHSALVENQTDASALNVIDVEDIRTVFPDAVVITSWGPSSKVREVLSVQEEQIGTLLQTSPIGNTAIGYLGPTNLMVVLSADDRILDIQILNSADTVEHVRAVANSKEFFKSYRGLEWSFPDLWPEIDTVSGATLTSYAVKQAVQARAGSQLNLSKFPDQIQSSELTTFYADNSKLWIANTSGDPNIVFGSVYDSGNATVGYYLRSSPTANSLSGYQGPTDTLVAFDSEFRYLGSLIRSSYDNEPYVGYVKEDSYLDELLFGKKIDEIAEFSESEYEGVSGATMTSLNVLSGIRTTVKHLQKYEARTAKNQNWTWIITECLTALLCLAGIYFSFAGINRSRRWRFVFQSVLIIYLGFIAGEILSQAVMVGWAQNGLPFSNAPGMVFLCLSALAVPVISKNNSYCDQICPFGALQQLSMKSGIRKVKLTSRVRRGLKLIPAALLIIVLFSTSNHLEVNLASIEPFDAFSFRIAGWLTIAIALTGMVVSLFVPMAYCRYGCPTGAVLSFLRFNGQSGKLHLRDGFAVAMLVFALLLTN